MKMLIIFLITLYNVHLEIKRHEALYSPWYGLKVTLVFFYEDGFGI